MCTINDVVNAVGTVVSSIVRVNTAKKEGEYRTKLLINEAKKAENEAGYQRQEGIEKARREKLNSILKMGDKRTRIAGSNIALSSQTALYTIEDVKQESELSALDEIKSAKRKSDLYMNRAQSYYQDAQLNAYNVKKNYRNSLLNSFYKF